MESILGFIGIYLLCSIGFIVGILVVVATLNGIGNVAYKTSESLSKIIYVKAVKDFLPILLTSIFLGTCFGAAFKLLFNISAATLTGSFLGFIIGSVIGTYKVSKKWNLCYVGQHEYVLAHYSDEYENYDYQSCKWCDSTIYPRRR